MFVQFDDGTTWGDKEAGRNMLAERPAKLAYLTHVVELYDSEGNAAFLAALNSPVPRSPEYKVAMCLKGDAYYDKIATIDLARKRLADAQSWHTYGIF